MMLSGNFIYPVLIITLSPVLKEGRSDGVGGNNNNCFYMMR